MNNQPNFLFFMTDQLRSDYLSCAGHPILKTPHIDSIAAEGTRFERFFVASPVCMPNRASFMTGRYPSVHGVRHNGHSLSQRANTFVDVLREGGYHTAHIGKSHLQPFTGKEPYPRVDPESLGSIKEAWKEDGGDYEQEEAYRYSGTERFRFRTPFYGFDHVDMVTEHGDIVDGHYLQWLRERLPNWQTFYNHENELPHNFKCPQAYRTALPEELYPTFYIRDQTIEYLNRQKDEEAPFFAFVSFPDPHHPFNPPGKYWSMYNPEDFEVPLPHTAHKNPPPPLINAQQALMENDRPKNTQTGFMAHDWEIKEMMALTCGMITMIDDAIGTMIETLRETGLYDNTVIVFNADHGDYMGDFNMMLKGAWPLRSITQVPFLWSDPQDRTTRTSKALASTLDIAPSIIARAGLKPYWGIQGTDFRDCVAGEHTLRSSYLIEFQDGMKRLGFPEPAFVRSLLTEEFRFTLYKGVEWGELYNLRNDPDETHNRFEDPEYSDIRSELTELLLRKMMDAIDQSPLAKRLA